MFGFYKVFRKNLKHSSKKNPAAVLSNWTQEYGLRMNPSRKWALWDTTTFIKTCTRPFLYVCSCKKFCFVLVSAPFNHSRRSRHSWKKCTYSSHPVLGKEENKRGLCLHMHHNLCYTEHSLSKAGSVHQRAQKKCQHTSTLTLMP